MPRASANPDRLYEIDEKFVWDYSRSFCRLVFLRREQGKLRTVAQRRLLVAEFNEAWAVPQEFRKCDGSVATLTVLMETHDDAGTKEKPFEGQFDCEKNIYLLANILGMFSSPQRARKIDESVAAVILASVLSHEMQHFVDPAVGHRKLCYFSQPREIQAWARGTLTLVEGYAKLGRIRKPQPAEFWLEEILPYNTDFKMFMRGATRASSNKYMRYLWNALMDRGWVE